MYDTILLPTDGSDGSNAAAEHAIDHAERYDAALHVVFVVDANLTGAEVDVPGLTDRLTQRGDTAVDRVAHRAREAGLEDVTTAVLSGRPHQTIVEYVDDHGVDLVVMGTHGRSGFDRYLLGSVTENVLRAADVPVLAVHRED
jgi:nucleotide-binding universal stress UspA family protein